MELHTIALFNLRRRKARAAFLIAGLLIGIGTVVALLSLTQSMSREATATMKSYGANIVISPRTKDIALSYGGIAVGGLSVGANSLSADDLARVEALKGRAGIATIAPELVGAVRVGDQRVLLMGVRPDAQFELKRWWSVDTGRPPANDREVVAGADVVKALNLQMGDYLKINGRRFTLTGLLRETGSQDDRLLVADLAAAQQLLKRPGELTLIEVAAKYGAAPVDQVAQQLRAALPGARVTTMQEAVDSRRHALDQFSGFSYAIVGVVVAIEALVVFITMMGSVSERTHEIGVFRAIGFRRVHITHLILIEAAVASLLAGVLGYFAGMGVVYAVLPVLAAGASVVWTPLLGIAAVALAIAVGCLASLYPALHAGKLDPTEALRAL
ncbi:MAG TPA: ABC transporter permease [Thermoleophilia bacterium]|nr:ABC transporter permease [Thermoleophilia bacterium]